MIDIDAIIDSMGWSLDADERADMRRLCQATLTTAAEQSGESASIGELPDSVIDATAAAIGGDAYDCMRVWSAWGAGTMGPDDFASITDDGDRVAEVARAAIEAYVAVHPSPAADSVVIDNLRHAFANAARWGGHEACHKVDVSALLAAAPSPN
ncbi:hypothetical protein [Chromobacterium violaceum]|uniref:hypothetical protein n=1 Tax=Chromobacterium violaceum TaxID=536 RepID=UPI0005BA1035|nr:hypothetical protein [Chromobacterium violaceum]